MITIVNHDYYSHPFYLHGHVFQIVKTGHTCSRESKFPLDAPVRRDTVFIRGGHYAVLRFRADNPGVWILHRHITWHLYLGLAATFVEAPKLCSSRHFHHRQCTWRQSTVAENPTPYNDRFESPGPPSGWKLVLYMLHGSDDID
ncbi:ferroxidase fet3 [Coemansia sp. RSA 355]|nr:ferroxidase fet3 [Coemansia sp. RSA 522]KAJ2289781.1 ferroxidase fet3 [Coemansia sp. RSA 355]